MKRANFMVLVAIVMTGFAVAGVSSGWYDQQWRRAEKAEKQQMPVSALNIVKQIETTAVGDGNSTEQLRALDKMLTLRASIDWSSGNILVDSLRGLSVQFTTPTSQMLYCLSMAQWLGRTNLPWSRDIRDDFRSLPVNEWSNIESRQAALEYVTKGLKDRDLFKGVDSKPYKALLDNGNEKEYPSPDLYVAVMRRAIEVLSSVDLGVKGVLWKELLEYLKPYPDLYVEVYMNGHTNMPYGIEGEYIAKMDSLVSLYPKDNVAVRPMVAKLRHMAFNRELRDEKVEEDYFQKISDQCDAIIKRFPRSRYIAHAKELKKDLSHKFCSFEVPTQIFPNAEVEVEIGYKNINKLIFEVYHLSDTLNRFDFNAWGNEVNLLRDIKRKKPLLRRSIEVASPLNIEKKSSVNITLTEMGRYLVLIKDGKGDAISSGKVVVSGIGAVYRVSKNRNQIYVADFMSGEPYDSILLESKDGTKESLSLSGFTKFTTKEGNSNVIPTRGDDIYSIPFYVYDYNRDNRTKDLRRLSIYTDRLRYKPKDTLFFKAHSYTIGKGAALLAGEEELFYLLSPNGDRVAQSGKLTSDIWGGYSGYFVIPEGNINGTYRINAGNGRSLLGNTIVNVDSYKQPTLYLKINPVDEGYSFGDSIDICGAVKSFAGYNIANATIKYTVTVTPNRYFYSYYFQSKEVVSAETVSDGNGDFKFSFVSIYPTESLMRYSAVYRVVVSATDQRGETQEAVKNIYIGTQRYHLRCDMPDVVDKLTGLMPLVEVQNLEGTSQSDLKGRYTLYEGKNEILKGDFVSNNSLTIPWAELKSGSYKIVFSMDQAEEIEHSFLLFSPKESAFPADTVGFMYALKNEEPIKFIFATSKEKIYALVEVCSADSVLSSQNMVFEKGLRECQMPYMESYPDKVTLNMTFIYGGKSYQYHDDFERKVTENPLVMKLVTLREKSRPGAKEQLLIEVKDSFGKGVESSVVLTVYDKSTDKPFLHSFEPINAQMPHEQFALLNHSSCFSSTSGLFVGKTHYRLAKKGINDEKITSYVMYMPTRSGGMLSKDGESVEEEEDVENGQERADFRSTALFYPSLFTDEEGMAKVDFIYPDNLTTYNIMAMAVARDLRSVVNKAEIVVSKEVMVMSAFPQFMRSGDSVVLRVQALNKTSESLQTTLSLEIVNVKNETFKPIKLLLNPSSDAIVEFAFKVPHGVDKLDFRLELSSDKHKDIELRSVPVAEDVERYARSRSYILPGDRLYLDLKEIVGMKRESAERLSVNVWNPTTALIRSIPYGIDRGSSSLIAILNNWYLTGAGSVMVSNIHSEIAKWDVGSEAILSSKTPWSVDSPSERIKEIKSLADKDSVTLIMGETMATINSYQNSDGGFPWFKGMSSSVSVTMLMLDRYADLVKCGYYDNSSPMEMLSRAVKWLDNQMLNDLEMQKKADVLSFDVLNYLSVRGSFMSYDLSPKCRDMWRYFLGRVEKQWSSYPIIGMAQIALVLDREGRDIKPIIASLNQYAVKNSSLGVYFPNAVMPFRGLVNSELRVHAMLLELFARSPKTNHLSAGIAQWLMLQRKNQAWENTTATADVILALWNYYSPAQNGDNNVKVSIPFKHKNGYEIDPNLIRGGDKEIVIAGRGDAMPMFVDVIYSCEKPLSQIEAQGNGFEVKRRLYRVTGGLQQEVSDSTVLNVGDQIVARYYIKNDENRSFVHLRSLRSGALQPINDVSGYAFGHYREVKESVINYYFYLMPEGDNFIEERFYVALQGCFNDGYLSIESLLSPAYQANSSSGSIRVADPFDN